MPRLPFIAVLISIVALATSIAAVRPAWTQGLIDPDAARAVVRCQKAVNKAARTFANAKLGNLNKCVETELTCLQVKAGDIDCEPQAATTCTKQFIRTDQAITKLRTSIGKACGPSAVPYSTLRLAVGLDIDGLRSTCLPFGIGSLDTLESYTECVFRIADCRVDDVVEAGTPRAEELLGRVGRSLRAVYCPTPAPTSTAAITPTPSRTATPVVTVTATPLPTATLTATPTPIVTPTSVTPTPTPTVTATVTESPTPTATPTETVTPTATVTPGPFNLVFVTSTTHTGNLGGLDGADGICNTRAMLAGLPGIYVAWLSTSTVDALSRIGGARGFVRTDGEPFADQPSDLVTSNEVWNAIHLDENGNDVGMDSVWTGTLKNGTDAPLNVLRLGRARPAADASAAPSAARLSGRNRPPTPIAPSFTASTASASISTGPRSVRTW